jgi:DNA-binding transcriptional ArsR family regulator
LTIEVRPAILKHVLNQETQLNLMFHALADANRRSMLQQLGAGPCSVTELARPLSMSLAGVVQHVQILETSGLISSTKRGRTRTCRLNPVALSAVEKWIAERQSHVERQLDRLGEILDSSSNHQHRRDQ